MSSTLWRRPPPEAGQRAQQLAFAVSLCAGALGAAASLISFIARARFYATPQHPPLGEALFLGSIGLLAGLLVIAGLLKLVGVTVYRPRSLFVWLLAGLLYGVALPFVTGALLPPGAVLAQTVAGASPLAAFLPGLLDALFALPWAALSQGLLGLPAGLLAGAVLAPAAWVIDRAACSPHRARSTYGALGIALVVALGVLALVALAPASLLARLGWGGR